MDWRSAVSGYVICGSSAGTLRGAELLRAEDAETRTVVCEMTEGGAPAGVFYRLNDHFGWGFQS